MALKLFNNSKMHVYWLKIWIQSEWLDPINSTGSQQELNRAIHWIEQYTVLLSEGQLAITRTGFTKNNHLSSCIRYANALTAVIIFIRMKFRIKSMTATEDNYEDGREKTNEINYFQNNMCDITSAIYLWNVFLKTSSEHLVSTSSDQFKISQVKFSIVSRSKKLVIDGYASI